MVDPLRLRDAGSADTDRIAALFRHVRLVCLPALPVLHSPDEDRHFFRVCVLPAGPVRLAEVDGRLAGFIAWREGWVDHLYVDPQHHGRGIGRALLDEAKADQPHLNLWVFQVNHRARRFYERQGFTLAEETDGSGNEEREPDARYVWSRAEAS